eukprot:gene5014-5126_t
MMIFALRVHISSSLYGPTNCIKDVHRLASGIRLQKMMHDAKASARMAPLRDTLLSMLVILREQVIQVRDLCHSLDELYHGALKNDATAAACLTVADKSPCLVTGTTMVITTASTATETTCTPTMVSRLRPS